MATAKAASWVSDGAMCTPGLGSHILASITREATIEVPEGWQSRLVKALDGHLFGDRRIRARADAPADSPSAGEDHFQRLARLLDLESRAEAHQAALRGQRLLPVREHRLR